MLAMEDREPSVGEARDMSNDAICFELRGDVTIRSAAACMSGLDRLLTELSKAAGVRTPFNRPIRELHGEARWFSFQVESAFGDAAADADHVAGLYIKVVQALGLARPTGLPQAVDDAALDLLSAACAGGGSAGFWARDIWIDAALSAWSRRGAAKPFPLTGRLSGNVIDVCDGDRPYAIVRNRWLDEYRCYLSTKQLEEARDGIDRPAYVSGPLVFEPDCAAQTVICPSTVFDIAGHPKTQERMVARRKELGLSGATPIIGLVQERSVGG